MDDLSIAAEVLATGRGTVQERAALAAVVPDLPRWLARYRRALRRHAALPPTQLRDPELTDLKSLATNVLGGPTDSNPYRAAILLKSQDRNHRCVYCEIEDATDVDHFVPQSKHAEFALEPVNLVGACGRCNGRKLSLAVAPDGSRLPHPYLDPPQTLVYLRARVFSDGVAIGVEYRNDWPAADVSPHRRTFVVLHRRLHLMKRYAHEGAKALSENAAVIYTADESGFFDVWINRQVDSLSRQYHANHYLVALYRGLREAWAAGLDLSLFDDSPP